MIEFPPVYCITLRESYYRRVETQKHFDSQGITPIWFQGINGITAGIGPLVSHETNLEGTKLYIHPSRVGNALSHVFALERGLADGSEEFFVMEDDVVLCDDFKANWMGHRPTLPDDIQVIQCAVTLPEDKPTAPINDWLEHRYYPFCSTCTWWRRSGAEFAVKTMRPFNSPVDIMFANRVYPFIGHAITIQPMAWDHSGHQKGGKWPTVCSPVCNPA